MTEKVGKRKTGAGARVFLAVIVIAGAVGYFVMKNLSTGKEEAQDQPVFQVAEGPLTLSILPTYTSPTPIRALSSPLATSRFGNVCRVAVGAHMG